MQNQGTRAIVYVPFGTLASLNVFDRGYGIDIVGTMISLFPGNFICDNSFG